MTDRARFTLSISLHDRYGEQRPLTMAIDLDEEVRISPRIVDDMKFGREIGASLVSMDEAVRVMKKRVLRKDLFTAAAKRLGALLAERMEDAEGWHDESRIEPAREQLGGRWR